jgi:hypothetical protein
MLNVARYIFSAKARLLSLAFSSGKTAKKLINTAPLSLTPCWGTPLLVSACTETAFREITMAASKSAPRKSTESSHSIFFQIQVA